MGIRKITDGELEALGLTPALPRHVGIIMDGNGRWAKAHGRSRAAGHRAGMDRVHFAIQFSSDMGMDALTLYAFSTENWKRPEAELKVLFSLLVEYFNNEIDELDKNNVKLIISGDMTRFPENVRRTVENAVEKTAGNTGMVANIALNYGSRAEVARAAREIAFEVQSGALRPEDVDEDAVRRRLYTAELPDMDLVIRTSGEERLSNFFMQQAAYAELVFIGEHWPDFDEALYSGALREYQRRDRRYGGL